MVKHFINTKVNERIVCSSDSYFEQVMSRFMKKLVVKINSQTLEYKVFLLDKNYMELVCEDILDQLSKVNHVNRIQVQLK